MKEMTLLSVTPVRDKLQKFVFTSMLLRHVLTLRGLLLH